MNFLSTTVVGWYGSNFGHTSTKWRFGLSLLLALLGAGCDTSPPLAVQPDAAGRQYVLDTAFAGSIMEFTANDGAKLGYVSYRSSEAKVAHQEQGLV